MFPQSVHKIYRSADPISRSHMWMHFREARNVFDQMESTLDQPEKRQKKKQKPEKTWGKLWQTLHAWFF